MEFTSDRQKLEDAVTKLRPQSTFGHGGGTQCPDVSYYLADLILNQDDEQALLAVVQHTIVCAHVGPQLAKAMALSAARRELFVGEQDYRVALWTLRRSIRRLAEMPGTPVVLTSPGFFAQAPEAISDTAEVLDLAAKSGVIVSGLDARGLYVGGEDASEQGEPSQLWLDYSGAAPAQTVM